MTVMVSDTGRVQTRYVGWTRRGNGYVTRRRKGRQGSSPTKVERMSYARDCVVCRVFFSRGGRGGLFLYGAVVEEMG